MRKKFSKKWKASKQPRKQRKYLANAPINIRRVMVSANLHKLLRKKYQRRSFPLRRGDVVKIMGGRFKGKKGKINSLNMKNKRAFIDGVQINKKDGTKVNFPIHSSNIQIQELNLDDKKRLNAIERKIKGRENVQEKTNN